MTERRRVPTPARLAVAGVVIAGGALVLAGQAAADPVAPTPVPSDPSAPTPAPGQPVFEPADGPIAPPAPPPVGAPVVPEIANPGYGSGSGPLGSLRDIWHQIRDGGNPMQGPTPTQAGMVVPPPGAAAGPPLPPGYYPIDGPPPPGYYDPPVAPGTPGSSTGIGEGGPPLPPGYYPLDGPPPPGYYDSPPAPEAAAPPAVAPVPPTP